MNDYTGNDSGRVGYYGRIVIVALLLWATGVSIAVATQGSGDGWCDAMLAERDRLRRARPNERERKSEMLAFRDRLEHAFPVQWDWMLQDSSGDFAHWLDAANWRGRVEVVLDDLERLGVDTHPLRARLDGVQSLTGREVLELYVEACRLRRGTRLRSLFERWERFVFAKHHNMGSSHYAYTEALSDSQYPRDYHWFPGSALCVLSFDGLEGVCAPLLEDGGGVIRNPDVSWDGKRVLFSWKKSLHEDDYHLYELEVASGEVRQLTSGLGFADYEGVYLPNGDILFNSTRCVQTVDCWWTEVSNLYLMDGDGRYMRRVSFDQVHTNFPTVTGDGRVLYTRWDYNDRGQLFPQGLFHMNPDGTAQMEFYGNSSWFPTTLIHARHIPGSRLYVAIATGHHTFQGGQLALIDPGMGRQENEGVRLIAPARETQAVRIDRYGQSGPLFQYPYPIDEISFLVSYHPLGYDRLTANLLKENAPHPGLEPRYGIYWMDVDGNRELLINDENTSCNQIMPLAARERPPVRPDRVDYARESGTFYVRDVYSGPGLQGVERGEVKALRVVALDYRAAGVGQNRNEGPAGSALVSTPIAADNGSWDVKRILGDATVHEDGSAYFEAPARTPVYFQALDDKGRAVQTMRSWSVLQPGEVASCVGCHDDKNEAAALSDGSLSQALRGAAEQLKPFYGPPRGFSFQREIQPILDRHCVQCHNDRSAIRGGKPGARHRATASHVNPTDCLDAPGDGASPASSDDLGIPRFTWWPRRGGREWLQYDFDAPRVVDSVSVYWFDDEPRGGGCRTPGSWELFYRVDDRWRRVPGAEGFGVERDTYNTTAFPPVQTTGLRLVARLRDNASAGVLAWRLTPDIDERAPAETGETRAFSLLDTANLDTTAKRHWSDAYLNLTRGGPDALVAWLNAQSVPELLPPRHAGAVQSRLLPMLEEGHNEVALTSEELEKIAAWIDLLVPYCGDYTEANAWSEEERKKYDRFQQKRDAMEALERENIEALRARQ